MIQLDALKKRPERQTDRQTDRQTHRNWHVGPVLTSLALDKNKFEISFDIKTRMAEEHICASSFAVFE